jgi:hypothetical protein
MGDETMYMTSDTEGCFRYCMRAGTPKDILVFLCSAFTEAPAGLLLDFAEGKKVPVFKDNKIVGFDEVEPEEAKE